MSLSLIIIITASRQAARQSVSPQRDCRLVGLRLEFALQITSNCRCQCSFPFARPPWHFSSSPPLATPPAACPPATPPAACCLLLPALLCSCCCCFSFFSCPCSSFNCSSRSYCSCFSPTTSLPPPSAPPALYCQLHLQRFLSDFLPLTYLLMSAN